MFGGFGNFCVFVGEGDEFFWKKCAKKQKCKKGIYHDVCVEKLRMTHWEA